LLQASLHLPISMKKSISVYLAAAYPQKIYLQAAFATGAAAAAAKAAASVHDVCLGTVLTFLAWLGLGLGLA